MRETTAAAAFFFCSSFSLWAARDDKTNACREWASDRGALITVDNCLRVDLVIKLTPKAFSFDILAGHREAA